MIWTSRKASASKGRSIILDLLLGFYMMLTKLTRLMKKLLRLACATFLLANLGAAFGQGHAYIWDATNGARDIGTLGITSYATAINDSGTVIGEYIPDTQSYQQALEPA